MMFIRALNKGNLTRKKIEDLHRDLYPGKEKRFDMILKKTLGKSAYLKSIQEKNPKRKKNPERSLMQTLKKFSQKNQVNNLHNLKQKRQDR